MAKFNTLEELLNTTDGMAVLRNNVKQDDGTDTIVGVDWFKFNNVVTTTLYSSGNSWMGFGASAEHLKVCRRDAAMFYLYRQEGTIGSTRFLKVRWEGYSAFSQTGASYVLKYEVFLFDTGHIYLNLLAVPSQSGYLGTNQLVCGTNTYSYTVTLGTPIEYTFYAQDGNGSTWAVAQERPTIAMEHVTEGAAIYDITGMDAIGIVNSGIFWNEDVPEDTTLTVSVSLDGEIFEVVENGDPIAETGTDVTELWIKVEMATEDIYVTPSFSQLRIWFQDEHDKYVLVLHMGPNQRFLSAAGDISVAYDASVGNLAGLGGPVDSFDISFTPEDLIAKPHQNLQHHIEIANISAIGTNIRVYHSFYDGGDEHIEVANISAVAALIHIDDI